MISKLQTDVSTAEQLWELPAEGQRYELIRGKPDTGIRILYAMIASGQFPLLVQPISERRSFDSLSNHFR